MSVCNKQNTPHQGVLNLTWGIVKVASASTVPMHMQSMCEYQCCIGNGPFLRPSMDQRPCKRSTVHFFLSCTLRLHGCRRSAAIPGTGSTSCPPTRHSQQHTALCCHERQLRLKLLGAAPGGHSAVRGTARLFGRHVPLYCAPSRFHMASLRVRKLCRELDRTRHGTA